MIYLDYNATTPLCDAAREAMLPYFSQHFGNPSSIHRAGRNARAAVDNARDKIAGLIHAKPNEIIFTSGGTESCNLAVLGLARCGMDGGGFLFLRSGLSLKPILFGGAHENQRRPGTENVPAIAGMAAAAEFVLTNRRAEQDRQLKLRDEFWDRIAQNIPDAKLNGEEAPRLANTLNVSLLGLDSEMLLIALDLKSVCASSGSACMVGSVSASHVLLAMGLPVERARSAVRFSLGKQTTADEIEAAGKVVAEIVERLSKRKSAHAVA